MKKTINFLLALSLLTSDCRAQNDDYVKKPSFAFYFAFDDFNAADYIRSNSIHDAIQNNKIANFKGMDPGLAIGYLQGISKHFDYAITLAGNFTDYPARANDGTTLGSAGLLLEADASIVGKMFSDKHFFTPFFKVGVGASEYEGYYGAFIPLGVGLQFKLAPDAFALFNWQYRLPVTEMVNYHFYYSVGIAASIVEGKAQVIIPPPPPPIVEAPKDRDGDGIVDSLDECPDVAGLPQFHGCPDTDGDGIPDKDDKCPTVAGIARYNGCPIPDTDGDGINDELDKCPTVAGFARYNGCPIPDTDGDGVNDEEDKCPNLPGTVANHGCPEIAPEITKRIAVAAHNIYFVTGSAKLLPKSYKALDIAIGVLKGVANLKLDINGYTDNKGKADKNLVLSENRAKAVFDYLKKKGITEERLKSAGFGQEQPIADNKTSAGRSKNRRVEMKLHYD